MNNEKREDLLNISKCLLAILFWVGLYLLSQLAVKAYVGYKREQRETLRYEKMNIPEPTQDDLIEEFKKSVATV